MNDSPFNFSKSSEFRKFCELSSDLGRNPLLVQGAGGNTSIKEYLRRVINEVLDEEKDAIRAFGKVAVAALDAPALTDTVTTIQKNAKSGMGAWPWRQPM